MGLKIGWFSDLIILILLVKGLIKTQKSLWKKIIAEIIRMLGGHFGRTYFHQRETESLRLSHWEGKKVLAKKNISHLVSLRRVTHFLSTVFQI